MVIELKNGRLTLQGETLFAGLSLRAKEGEVVFVDSLPQQAHTPLMHALMGLLPLDEGFVSIDGEVLSERSAQPPAATRPSSLSTASMAPTTKSSACEWLRTNAL